MSLTLLTLVIPNNGYSILPGAVTGGNVAVRGMEVWAKVGIPLFARILGWGRSAARRFNEYPGPVNAEPEPSESRASEVAP